MTTEQRKTLKELLEDLAGQRPPILASSEFPSFPKDGIGYSQFNELLLLLGYDRVTHAFFQFLVDGTLDYHPGSGVHTSEQLETGIERVRQLSLLYFGNIKFGFKKLARDSDELAIYQNRPVDAEDLRRRHGPIYPVDPIPTDSTYFLGYVVQNELKRKLESAPNDAAALADVAMLKKVIEQGIRNQRAYLVSDHLDVYVATSMRLRHEYAEVAEFITQLFDDPRIKPLNLRAFDPTQAYCSDRIDKGLAEALMLKRAKCTIYLAQESDTLGKDSELASTLAQGKPVIAYVPSPTEQEIIDSVKRLAVLYSQPEEIIILERLQALSPKLAWTNRTVREWLNNPALMDRTAALDLLVSTARNHYKTRSELLMESHPLGIQVNLDTGVANGVLVVRTIKDCAELVYRIVTGRLEFRIENKKIDGVEYHLLRETISNSIFRVMTGDAMLTNCFWNFYLEPSE